MGSYVPSPVAGNEARFVFSERSSGLPKADVQRFMNRLLGFPLNVQSDLFDLFQHCVSEEVREAKSTGKYKGGQSDIPGVAQIKRSFSLLDVDAGVIYGESAETHSSSSLGGALSMDSGSILQHKVIEVNRGMSLESAKAKKNEENAALAAEAGAAAPGRKAKTDYECRFYMRREASAAHGRPQPCLAVVPKKSRNLDIKVKVWKPNVPMSRQTLRDFNRLYQKVSPRDEEELFEEWSLWYDHCGSNCAHFEGCDAGLRCQFGRRVEQRHILTGPVLDVWHELDELTKEDEGKAAIKVLRVDCSDGIGGHRRLVGLEVPEKYIEDVKRHLRSKSPGSVLPALTVLAVSRVW